MNEKPNISRRGARRSVSADLASAKSPNEVRAGSKCGGTDAGVDSNREFHDRQARTDAAVRAIPGLHDFGG
jgi:hypothetical protein